MRGSTKAERWRREQFHRYEEAMRQKGRSERVDDIVREQQYRLIRDVVAGGGKKIQTLKKSVGIPAMDLLARLEEMEKRGEIERYSGKIAGQTCEMWGLPGQSEVACG